MTFARNLKNVIIAATALAGYQGNTTHGIKLNKVNNFNGLDINGKKITSNESCVKSDATALHAKLCKMSDEEKENWRTQQEGYAKYMERTAYLTKGDVSKEDNYYVRKLAYYVNANGFAALREVPVAGKQFGEKTGHYLFVDSIADFWGGKVKVLFNNGAYGEYRVIDEDRRAFFNEDEIASAPTLSRKEKQLQLQEMKFTELLALIAPQNEKEFQFGDMTKYMLGESSTNWPEIPLSNFNKLSRTVRVENHSDTWNTPRDVLFRGEYTETWNATPTRSSKDGRKYKVLSFDDMRFSKLTDENGFEDYSTYVVEGFVKALNLREL